MSPNDLPMIETPFRKHPFRRAVLRGLAVVLPPLLTIVIFVWVGNTVAVYLLEPVEAGARRALAWGLADVREESDVNVLANGEARKDGVTYKRSGDEKFIPLNVYRLVQDNLGTEPMPPTAQGVYLRYVEIRYLQRHFVVPVFLCVFVFLLYLLGRFLAAGVGKFFWSNFERGIHRLPLVRNVYSSVKQVTDFLFTGSEIEYTRVIAVEYPRKGIWSLGLVTGESMLEIRDAAGEAVMTVLMPTSPMPFTGFTVTVKKSETIDLNITMDQAFQFIVSCGVVIPPQQIEAALGTADTNDTALPAPAGDPK